jgi:hypothetical protein
MEKETSLEMLLEDGNLQIDHQILESLLTFESEEGRRFGFDLEDEEETDRNEFLLNESTQIPKEVTESDLPNNDHQLRRVDDRTLLFSSNAFTFHITKDLLKCWEDALETVPPE